MTNKNFGIEGAPALSPDLAPPVPAQSAGDGVMHVNFEDLYPIPPKPAGTIDGVAILDAISWGMSPTEATPEKIAELEEQMLQAYVAHSKDRLRNKDYGDLSFPLNA